MWNLAPWETEPFSDASVSLVFSLTTINSSLGKARQATVFITVRNAACFKVIGNHLPCKLGGNSVRDKHYSCNESPDNPLLLAYVNESYHKVL